MKLNEYIPPDVVEHDGEDCVCLPALVRLNVVIGHTVGHLLVVAHIPFDRSTP